MDIDIKKWKKMLDEEAECGSIMAGDFSKKIDDMDNDKKCVWVLDVSDWDYWKTGCGNEFTLTDGTPEENDMFYCCFCGKKIEQE